MQNVVKILGITQRTVLFLYLCSSLCCVGAAAAEPVDEHELSRWVPSFSFLSGLNAQRAEGHLSTSDVLGAHDPAAPPQGAQPLLLPGSPRTERAPMLTPFVGGSIEVMSPAWQSLPGRPRAFSRFDVSVTFGPEYNIPTIGDRPGPPTRGSALGALTESTILGQGGRAAASVEPLLLMAGAGAAFTLDAWDHALRIKPSLEYIREQVEVRGVVRRSVVVDHLDSATLDKFRHVNLSARATHVYHGLGPGLELELDTRRAGPVVLSLYLGAKAWAFLNNDKQTLVAANADNEYAVFQFLKNRWAFSGNFGLRFRWVPE